MHSAAHDAHDAYDTHDAHDAHDTHDAHDAHDDHHMPDYGFGPNTEQIQRLIFEAEKQPDDTSSPGNYKLNPEAVVQVLDNLMEHGIVGRKPGAEIDQFSDMRPSSGTSIREQAMQNHGLGVLKLPKLIVQEIAARKPVTTTTGKNAIIRAYPIGRKPRSALVVRYDKLVDKSTGKGTYQPSGLTVVTTSSGDAFTTNGEDVTATPGFLKTLETLHLEKIKLASNEAKIGPDTNEKYNTVAIAQPPVDSKEDARRRRRDMLVERGRNDKDLLAARQLIVDRNELKRRRGEDAKKARQPTSSVPAAPAAKQSATPGGAPPSDTALVLDKTGRRAYEVWISQQPVGAPVLPRPMDTNVPFRPDDEMPDWKSTEQLASEAGADKPEVIIKPDVEETVPVPLVLPKDALPEENTGTPVRTNETTTQPPIALEQSVETPAELPEVARSGTEKITNSERNSFGNLMLDSAGSTKQDPRQSEPQDTYINSPEVGLVAVFNGMVNNPGGKEAAQTAWQEIDSLLAGQLSPANAEAQLQAVAVQVDRAIRQEAASRNVESGSTTVALMKLLEGGEQAGVMWAGNSRIYRMRSDNLEMLTLDDGPSGSSVDEQRALSSVVSQADIDAYGKEHKGSLLRFNQRHKVTGFLGKEEGAERNDAHVALIDVQPGDRYLLTSAGVHDNLTYEEIKEKLQNSSNPNELSIGLMSAAGERSQERPNTKNIRPKLADITAVALFTDKRESTNDTEIKTTQAKMHSEQAAEKPEASERQGPIVLPTPKEYSVRPNRLPDGEVSRFSHLVEAAGVGMPTALDQLNTSTLKKLIEATQVAEDLHALTAEIDARSKLVREDKSKREQARGNYELAAQISSAGMTIQEMRLERLVTAHNSVLRERARLKRKEAARINESRVYDRDDSYERERLDLADERAGPAGLRMSESYEDGLFEHALRQQEEKKKSEEKQKKIRAAAGQQVKPPEDSRVGAQKIVVEETIPEIASEGSEFTSSSASDGTAPVEQPQLSAAELKRTELAGRIRDALSARAALGVPEANSDRDAVALPVDTATQGRREADFIRSAGDVARAERQLGINTSASAAPDPLLESIATPEIAHDALHELRKELAAARTRKEIFILTKQAIAAGLLKAGEKKRGARSPASLVVPYNTEGSESLYEQLRDADADISSYESLRRYSQKWTPRRGSDLDKVKAAFAPERAHEAQFKWTPDMVEAVLATKPTEIVQNQLRTQLVVAGHLTATERSSHTDAIFAGEPVKLYAKDAVGDVVAGRAPVTPKQGVDVAPLSETTKPVEEQIEAPAVASPDAQGVEQPDSTAREFTPIERKVISDDILRSLRSIYPDSDLSDADWEQAMSEQATRAQQPGLNLAQVESGSNKSFSLESTGTPESDAFITGLNEITNEIPTTEPEPFTDYNADEDDNKYARRGGRKEVDPNQVARRNSPRNSPRNPRPTED